MRNVAKRGEEKEKDSRGCWLVGWLVEQKVRECVGKEGRQQAGVEKECEEVERGAVAVVDICGGCDDDGDGSV